MSIIYGNNIYHVKPAQQEQSFALEWVRDLIDSTSGFKWVESLEVCNFAKEDSIIPSKIEYIKLKPKWGFILYHGQVVSLLESIFQSTSGTAIERCFRWLAIANLPQISIPPSQILFSFYGSQFNKDEHGYISPTICKNLQFCAVNHINLLINPSLDQVEESVTLLLHRLKNQYIPMAAK